MREGHETATAQRPQDHRAAASKDAILDAAQRILKNQASSRLTIDAIAAEAAFSKGGVLHHFRSKQDIMIALLQRALDRFTARVDEIHKKADGKRSLLSAYVEAKIEHTRDDIDLPRSIITAAGEQPELLKPVRALYKKYSRLVIKEARDPGLAITTMLAADGLMFSSVFGLINTEDLHFAAAEKRLLSVDA